MELIILEPALKEIKKDFDKKTRENIFKKLEYLSKNYEALVNTKNIQKLQNSSVCKYRINLNIRAIFITYCEDDEMIVILSVTSRQNAYQNQKMQEYENLANNFKPPE